MQKEWYDSFPDRRVRKRTVHIRPARPDVRAESPKRRSRSRSPESDAHRKNVLPSLVGREADVKRIQDYLNSGSFRQPTYDDAFDDIGCGSIFYRLANGEEDFAEVRGVTLDKSTASASAPVPAVAVETPATVTEEPPSTPYSDSEVILCPNHPGILTQCDCYDEPEWQRQEEMSTPNEPLPQSVTVAMDTVATEK